MVIIAMLGSTMLLAQREIEASSQATTLLNDLRVMKAGAYLFFPIKFNFITFYSRSAAKYSESG
jgi:hypothetical protein